MTDFNVSLKVMRTFVINNPSTTKPQNSFWDEAQEELNNAFRAREAGLEGKARVCARRAAGKAFLASGLSETPTLAGIKQALAAYHLPEDITSICLNLMRSVDQQHNLNIGSDLLEDVIFLIGKLQDPVFVSTLIEDQHG